MSDPMTNIEIEDVLSSIRRLVAQDGGPPRPAAPGRLVLTPAQRVDDGAETAPSAELAAVGGDAPEVMAEIRSSVGQGSDPDPAPQPTGDLAEQGVPESAPAADLPDEGTFEGTAPPADVAPAPPEATSGPMAEVSAAAPLVLVDAVPARVPSLEESVAELEAAMARHDAEWEPDEPQSEEGGWRDESVLAGLAFLRSSTVAPPDPQPEQPGGDAAHHADDRLHAHLDDIEEAEVPRLPSHAPDPEEILDEELLRQMIADVLREELRGPLGERITSNLRKMVRREVQIAISGMLRN